MRRAALALCILLCAAGCATLTVSVDLYKHPIAAPFPGHSIEAESQAILAEPVFQEGPRQGRYADIVSRARTAVVTANAAAYKARGKPDPRGLAEKDWRGEDPSRRGGILELLDSTWAPVDVAASTVRSRAAEVADLHPSLCGAESCPEARQAYYALKAAQRQFYLELQRFRDQVIRALGVEPLGIDTATAIADWAAGALATGTGLAVSGEATGKVVAYPIFAAEIAEISRRSGDWVGFGRDRFAAFGGSAQFVVVREGHVVFRQKNLDFDPTPIIGAGAALAKLGLQVAAGLQSGGVALPAAAGGPSDGTGAPETAGPGAQVIVNEGVIDERRALLAYRTRAKRQLLLDLADLYEKAVQAKETEDAKQLERARTGVKIAIAAYQARTRPTGAGQ